MVLQVTQRAVGCRGLWIEYPLNTNFLTRSDHFSLTTFMQCLSCFTFFEQTQQIIVLDSSCVLAPNPTALPNLDRADILFRTRFCNKIIFLIHAALIICSHKINQLIIYLVRTVNCTFAALHIIIFRLTSQQFLYNISVL